jgi:hypothetical protein
MALQLSELPDHPGLIAATKIWCFRDRRRLLPRFLPPTPTSMEARPTDPLVSSTNRCVGASRDEGEHSGTLLPASTAAIRATHEFMPCGRRTTHPHHNHRHRSSRTKSLFRLRKAIPGGQPGMPCRMAFTGLNCSRGGEIFKCEAKWAGVVHVLTLSR